MFMLGAIETVMTLLELLPTALLKSHIYNF